MLVVVQPHVPQPQVAVRQLQEYGLASVWDLRGGLQAWAASDKTFPLY